MKLMFTDKLSKLLMASGMIFSMILSSNVNAIDTAIAMDSDIEAKRCCHHHHHRVQLDFDFSNVTITSADVAGTGSVRVAVLDADSGRILAISDAITFTSAGFSVALPTFLEVRNNLHQEYELVFLFNSTSTDTFELAGFAYAVYTDRHGVVTRVKIPTVDTIPAAAVPNTLTQILFSYANLDIQHYP